MEDVLKAIRDKYVVNGSELIAFLVKDKRLFLAIRRADGTIQRSWVRFASPGKCIKGFWSKCPEGRWGLV